MIFPIRTGHRTEFIDITSDIQQLVNSAGWISQGYCLLFVPHTTAGITINESADPDVRIDIQNLLNRWIPPSGEYRHREGNSDAHVKSTLVGVSQYIPIENNRLMLGTWQGIFFCEFDGPRNRRIVVQITAVSDIRP
jgi:secondary thiamine-phosphate synthase enzyme